MHPDKFMRRGKKAIAPKMLDAERAARREKLGQAVAAKRKEFVDARKASGIEAVWLACEEYYLGIDDANRHEFNDAKWSKPTSINGPVTKEGRDRDDARSTAFVRVTSRYVDGASAKVGEIILPIDDKAFKLDATPDPDLVKKSKDLRPLMDAAGQPVSKPPQEPEAGAAIPPPPDGTPPVPGGVGAVMTVADQAQQALDQAQDSAEKAETRIHDWLVECRYPAEARKMLSDSARIGVGVLKGPIPDFKTSRAVTKAPKGIALQIEKKLVPAVRWIDPWNLFPDDGCGENIHDGEGVFERDFLSVKKLKKLKDDPDYLADEIDKVVEEGPGKVYAENPNDDQKRKRNRFEIWYYYGTLKREDFECINEDGSKDLPANQDEVHAIVSMVNDTVIRAVLNPLDSGAFPYRVMPWSRRAGHWAGIGVAEQIFMPQRAVNASARALFNNAGISAGVQIVIDQLGIIPADNSWKITPNKVWYKTGESTASKVDDAFKVFEIPSVQQELSAIIEMGMKMAEQACGIPLDRPGQNSPATPQTFGQAELEDNNAHTWLRNIGYRYDDVVTDPLVNDLYEWLLLDDTVPDEEKDNFNISAHGSVAMVERAIQEQTLIGLMGSAINPAFRISPYKLAAEVLKSKRLDPRKVQYTDQEWDRISQQPPPPAPAVQAAQINAAAKLHVADMQGQQKMQELAAQTQVDERNLVAGGTTPHEAAAMAKIRDSEIRAQTAMNVEASRAQAEAARGQKELEIANTDGYYRMRELEMQRDILLLEYAQKRDLDLMQVKGQLANTALQLHAKHELNAAGQQFDANENAADRAVDLHKHHTSLEAKASNIDIAPQPEPLSA